MNKILIFRYTGAYQFLRPALMIKDPELIKQITVKDFDHFTDHSNFIEPEADPLWGGNLFSLKGKRIILTFLFSFF